MRISNYTKKLILIISTLLLLFGCSSTGPVTTKEFKPDSPISQRILSEAKILSATAFYHYQAGRFRQAIQSYLSAISKLILIDNHQEIAKIYNNIGSVYIKLGNLKKARYFIKKSYIINSKHKFYKEMAFNLSTLGQLQEFKKNYVLAINRYQTALAIFLRLSGQAKEVAEQFKNIGYIYFITKKNIKALNMLNKSLRLSIALKKYDDVAENYSYIGKIYLRLNQPAKALINFKNALNADKAVENPANIAADLKNIGMAHEKLKQFETALLYYQRASKINSVLKRPKRLVKDLKNLIRIYKKLNKPAKAQKINIWLQKLTKSLKKRN